MVRRKLYAVMLVLFLSIFMVACGDDASSDKEQNNAEAQEETNKDTEKKEEKAVPSDEELIAVLEENIQTLMDKDLDAHMETIHSESPGYEGTKQTIQQLNPYTIDMQLSDMKVEEKSETEARVAFTQTNIKQDGPQYQNNKTVGVNILRPDDGVWKIYNTEVIETIALDENGEPIEQSGNASVAPSIEGEYASIITGLEMPFDSDKWVIGNYQEQAGEAIAEFLPAGETLTNYTELLSLHYFKDGKNTVGVKTWVNTMEQNLTNMITGNLEFNKIEVSDKEGLYEFAVTEDPQQFDQEEIARVFVKGNDLFVVRYTLMEQTFDKATKKEMFDKLKSVK